MTCSLNDKIIHSFHDCAILVIDIKCPHVISCAQNKFIILLFACYRLSSSYRYFNKEINRIRIQIYHELTYYAVLILSMLPESAQTILVPIFLSQNFLLCKIRSISFYEIPVEPVYGIIKRSLKRTRALYLCACTVWNRCMEPLYGAIEICK